jgi:predicted O-linked N-acetylglucosamine transferase (SPINDLY family)
MSASLLSAIGLETLITKNLDEYQALAIRLGCDRQLLGTVKQKVTAQKTAGHLFNTKATVGHLEKAYTAMWNVFEKGGKARTITL